MTAFATAIQEKLSEFWDEQTVDGGDAGPFGVGPLMDSLTTTFVLSTIEELVDVKDLPDGLVQRGGYQSKKEFMEVLGQRICNHLDEVGV
jgi:hypothetical protein